MKDQATRDQETQDREIRELWRSRPRDRFLRWTTVALIALAAVAWLSGGFDLSDTFSARRLANLQRFGVEVVPYPLREEGFSLRALIDWCGGLLADGGLDALGRTLWISVLAIVLAGLAAGLIAPFAARSLMTPEPYLPAARPTTRMSRLLWQGSAGLLRLLMMFLRAVPEFVWAFLLLAMLGPNAWPAILALALHNAGILGRLGAEVIEHSRPPTPAALRALGSSRAQITLASIVPATLGRGLSLFLYRWETCVREATVLGLLGILSLGYQVAEARAANRYDEMLFFVLLGATLVVGGDLLSVWTRRRVRG